MATSLKGRRFPSEVLTHEEVVLLLKSFSRRSPSPVRLAAMCAVAYGGGLRVGEVLQLRSKDIRKDGTCHIHHGKGDKARTVHLNESALAYMDRWRKMRATALKKRGVKSSKYLFCTLSGGPIDPRQIRAAMERAGRHAGLEKRTNFHSLRHSHAMRLVKGGADMSTLQKNLGHSSLKVTSVYVAHVDNSALKEASTLIPEF